MELSTGLPSERGIECYVDPTPDTDIGVGTEGSTEGRTGVNTELETEPETELRQRRDQR